MRNERAELLSPDSLSNTRSSLRRGIGRSPSRRIRGTSPKFISTRRVKRAKIAAVGSDVAVLKGQRGSETTVIDFFAPVRGYLAQRHGLNLIRRANRQTHL
jgi:hypothetical protein